MPRYPPTIERLFAKVKAPPSWEGCFIWTGGVSPKGYGTIRHNGVSWPVHRVAFLLAFGHIDPDLTIDHLCGNKRCVNPLHLEECTAVENRLRAGYKKKTHCLRGHEYDEKNTRHYNGKQNCRQCHNMHQKAYQRGEKVANDRIEP